MRARFRRGACPEHVNIITTKVRVHSDQSFVPPTVCSGRQWAAPKQRRFVRFFLCPTVTWIYLLIDCRIALPRHGKTRSWMAHPTKRVAVREPQPSRYLQLRSLLQRHRPDRRREACAESWYYFKLGRSAVTRDSSILLTIAIDFHLVHYHDTCLTDFISHALL
jgi:hypothetical protein